MPKTNSKGRPKQKHATPSPTSKAPPDRRALDAAECRLLEINRVEQEALAKLSAERDELDRREENVGKTAARDRRTAEKAREEARAAYKAAGG